MGQSAGGGKTRLELAQDAAVNGLAQLSDTDEVGLWTFPIEGTGVLAVPAIEPLGPRRQLMTTRIQQLIPSGGTPLYAVTRKASEAVRAAAGADTINAIVVMTDGNNEIPRRQRSRRAGAPAQ